MAASPRSPRLPLSSLAVFVLLTCLTLPQYSRSQSASHTPADDFRTSDRCVNCHNNLKTAKGEDVSIGVDWSASIMANAARDPYWQGSVRRETIDHPESSAAIQSECASCHAPLQVLQDKAQNYTTEMFKFLPLGPARNASAAAADGVSCTVCHQIQSTGLGTAATDNGNFAVAPAGTQPRPLFGPYVSDSVNKVHVVASGYSVEQAAHIRDATLCATCHTLYTTSLGPGGKPVGRLPEQMTYLEWQQSSYRDKQTCQQCHMPSIDSPVNVSSLLGTPRDGVHRHTFTGANVLMQNMLSAHRDELAVTAQPATLLAASARTTAFLQSLAARVTVGPAQLAGSELSFAVRVENLAGHKLPTSYPSRRAWLHVVVTDSAGHTVFESGKLNADGSISGNVNDADPTRFSPHYTRITAPDQVEIFEPILGDSEGHVTTGLLAATQYLKDNRILPTGFDKQSAPPDIAVHGEAATDPDFIAGSSTTHYAIATNSAAGPFHISVELIYQSVGFRWEQNLAPYKADEPQRFVHYYDQAAAKSAIVLDHAETAAGN